VAVSYLHGLAHEWWLGYKETEERRQVNTWTLLQYALIRRFETLNKSKIARDKLARWKQIKGVPTYSEDFQRILLDIPTITMEEQLDRYARGLKSYIWKELCTKEYTSLGELMRDAERVEMAHRIPRDQDHRKQVNLFLWILVIYMVAVSFRSTDKPLMIAISCMIAVKQRYLN